MGQIENQAFVFVNIFGRLFLGRLLQFQHIGGQLDGCKDNARNLNHQMAVTLTLDTHNDTLATIVETASDTHLIALAKGNLTGFEIGDMLFVVLGRGNEVIHRLERDRQVVLPIGKRRLADKNGVMRFLNIFLHLIQRATHKQQTREGRHQHTLAHTTTRMYLILQRDKRRESGMTRLIAHMQLLTRADTAQSIP